MPSPERPIAISKSTRKPKLNTAKVNSAAIPSLIMCHAEDAMKDLWKLLEESATDRLQTS